MVKNYLLTGMFVLVLPFLSSAQGSFELNNGWKCQAIGKVKAGGGRRLTESRRISIDHPAYGGMVNHADRMGIGEAYRSLEISRIAHPVAAYLARALCPAERQ